MRVEINTVDRRRYTIRAMDDANVAQLLDAYDGLEPEPVLTVVLDAVKRKKKRTDVVAHIRRDAIVSIDVMDER